MSDEFVNIKDNSVDTGDIMSDDQAAKEKRLKMMELLKGNVSAPKEKESNLDNIEIVTGKASEEDVPIDKLIKAPGEWDMFPQATEDSIRKISTSIYQYGLLHKINVWEQRNGTYMILDGNTRVSCYQYIYDLIKDDEPEKALTYLKIPARIYKYEQLSEDDAQRIFIISNTDQRALSLKTTAEAYCRLMTLEKKKAFYGSGIYSRDAAAKQANVSPTTFTRYLRISTLYEPLLNETDMGAIPVKVAYMISMLPMELQQYIYDERIHMELTADVAKDISKCQTIDELKEALKKANEAPLTYKYTIQTTKRKPRNAEIIPLYVDKKKRQEVIEYLISAIDQSNFEDETKKALRKIISKAK